MRKFNLILFVFFIYSCKGGQHKSYYAVSDKRTPEKAIAADTADFPIVQYSLAQKLHFLDSVAKLDLQLLKDSLIFEEDSTFHNRKDLAISFTLTDFEKLKNACKSKKMDFNTAKRLFPSFTDTTPSSADDNVSLDYIPLSSNKESFEEFAVSLGISGWSSLVYFFKKNQLIAIHDIFHRYGLEVKHFKDLDGNTVVYYKQNFGSGSGIWQFNYFFYKYLGNRLVPVLNILENGNYTWPGPRTYWLETFVQNEKPLKLKFVYHFLFKDSIGNDMLNDSTEVIYTYEQTKRVYIGNYQNTKLNTDKVLTYYLGDSELLFIRAYHNELKAWIDGKDRIKRERTLNYLNEVMIYTAAYR